MRSAASVLPRIQQKKKLSLCNGWDMNSAMFDQVTPGGLGWVTITRKRKGGGAFLESAVTLLHDSHFIKESKLKGGKTRVVGIEMETQEGSPAG